MHCGYAADINFLSSGTLQELFNPEHRHHLRTFFRLISSLESIESQPFYYALGDDIMQNRYPMFSNTTIKTARKRPQEDSPTPNFLLEAFFVMFPNTATRDIAEKASRIFPGTQLSP